MDIVEEIRQDREKGAKRLESEYKAGLMALARRFCADSSDAEELVNATFATVIENIDGYLEQSAFFAWMCQILTSLHSRNVRRKSAQDIMYPGDVPDVLDENAQGAIYDHLDASLLRMAIDELPKEQRDALALHYFMDMSVVQIAKYLAVPTGTVLSRLHYARKALAAKLGAAAKKPGVKALLIALVLAALTAIGAAVVSAVGDARNTPPALSEGTPLSEGGCDAQESSPLREGAVAEGDWGSPATDNQGQSLADTSTPPFPHSSTPPLSPTAQGTQNMNAKTLRSLAASAATLVLAATAAAETIAYWPFGTNGFHDVSGNGHHLASTTVTESDAGYVTLNGTSQFLTTAAALDLSGETAVTFECWTRVTGKNSGFGNLFSSSNPGADQVGGFVVYYTGLLQAQFRIDSNNWQIDNSSGSVLGKIDGASGDGMWHHVAYVIDRTKTNHTATRLYVDGVEVGVAAGTNSGSLPLFFNSVFYIGGGSGYASGNNFLTGYIDDVRISSGALTPDQFLKYPTVGKSMRSDDDKLPVVAYWPFGGKGGKDATGNGFDLTISGVPMISGTPSPSYGDYARTNYYNGTFPFSAFSKTGLTIECYAKTGSSGGGMAGSLLETSTLYYNNTGAFQLRFEASSSYKTATAYFLASGKEGASPKYVRSPTSEDLFGALNDNRWRHYAIVYDPSKTGAGIVTLYVDGVAAPVSADNADQGAFALRDDKLYLARRDIGSGRGGAPFYGSIDDVRITGCALTPDQFLPARSAGSTVALYRFDRETLEDQSGNGNVLVNEGNATYGNSGHAASGTGIVLDGSSQWLHTLNGLDLTHTKAATIEFDYYSGWPGGWGSGNKIGPLVISDDVDAVNGISIYNPSSAIQAQWRVRSGTWRIDSGSFSDGNGYHEGRYSIDISASPQTALYVDGVKGSVNPGGDNSGTMDNLGSQVLHFGHGPNYVSERYLKGKFCRIAISDVALAQDDFVLDNLVLDTAKATLAYWNFFGSTDKSGNGHSLTESGTGRRNGALVLNGGASAATEDTLDLADLTQATIECFVLFGETPASGTLFGMGSGAGSFAVTADAAAGTLSGSFVPYDHLASSCGGVASLAPLAGKAAWHHVALVIDRTNSGADAVKFYVDYERAMPAGRAWDASARMLDATLSIGTGFTGRIDDVRVSAGALAPAEFIQLGARTETPDAFMLLVR